MYCVIEGNKTTTDDVVKLFKGADHTDKYVRYFNDDGTPFNLTGSTATILVYSDKLRTTLVATLSLTLVTATAGLAKLSLAVAGATFGPGVYFGFAKSDISGAIALSKNAVTIKVG